MVNHTDALSSWKLDKADWSAFSEACSHELNIDNTHTGDDAIKNFTENLISIASCTIPKSKAGKRTVNTVWFNSSCKDAIRSRKKALKRAKLSPTDQNIDNYRITRAKSRRIIRTSRRQSWQSFVSKINCRTSLKKVWNVISKISGKKSSTSINHLSVSNNEITSVPDIANTLGHTFSNNFSSQHYTDKFNSYRQQDEKQQLRFKSTNNETYNTLFSLQELTTAIENPQILLLVLMISIIRCSSIYLKMLYTLFFTL